MYWRGAARDREASGGARGFFVFLGGRITRAAIDHNDRQAIERMSRAQ